MPSIIFSFAESAVCDLEEIKTWYTGQDVPEVGERLVAELFQRVEALIDHPDLDRVVPEFGKSFLREIIHPPFRIVYRRDMDRIQVIRVWRSERLLRLSSDDN